MSGYSDGRSVEYRVIHHLTDHGYTCTRAASSKGAADVIAIRHGEALLINVKRTTPPGPAERIALLHVVEHLTFNRGNAIKYLWRAGDKGDAVEDLRKAAWYVAREIQRLGGQP